MTTQVTLTELETLFLIALEQEAYGGNVYTSDVNPMGMTKAQKSGVVSSLVQKKMLVIDTEYQQIGLMTDDDETDGMEAIWEYRSDAVKELIYRKVAA